MKTKRRELITVQLSDGTKIRVSNRAKKDNVRISEIIRRAIDMYLKWHNGL